MSAASNNSPTPIETAIMALTAKVDALTTQFATFESTQATQTHPPPPPPPPPSPNDRRPHMKLEVPRFDGTDALGWIFKISQFFDFHGTPDHERLTIASFYMDGAALSWFQWMVRNGLIMSWTDFLISLETCFAPSFYDDRRGALFKLTQRGTVTQYLTEFERLANHITGLPHPFLLSCFISGLSPEI